MQVSYLCWGFPRQASEGTAWALAPPVCSGRYSQPWWERIQGCTDSPYNSLNTAFTSGAHRRDVRPIQASPWPPECFSHRLLLVQSHKICSFNNRFQVQEWDEQDAQTTHTHTPFAHCPHTHAHKHTQDAHKVPEPVFLCLCANRLTYKRRVAETAYCCCES